MSLKTVLDYRRHLEELARVELARVAQELDARVDVVHALERELEKLLEGIARGERQGIPAGEGLALYRFAESLATNLAAARREAEAWLVRKEQQETVLREAARDCRVVEKLDAQRAKEQEQRDEHTEQQVNDEAGIRRWRDAAKAVTRDDS
jgi:flagellar export protein FliJ